VIGVRHGETITVRRPASPGTSPRGDPLPATEHTVAGCVIAPQVSIGQNASGEIVDRRDTVITGLALFAPPNADIRPTDRIVRADGTVWEVEGEPGDWLSPFTGWHPGIQLGIRRVTG
jgi:hypothetical protein